MAASGTSSVPSASSALARMETCRWLLLVQLRCISAQKHRRAKHSGPAGRQAVEQVLLAVQCMCWSLLAAARTASLDVANEDEGACGARCPPPYARRGCSTQTDKFEYVKNRNVLLLLPNWPKLL